MWILVTDYNLIRFLLAKKCMSFIGCANEYKIKAFTVILPKASAGRAT